MRTAGFILAGMILPALTGCGNDAKLAVTPVQGEILFQKKDGKTIPMAGARVIFHPTFEESKFPAFPVGKVKEDGSFSLGTYASEDGAPEGNYVVTVIWKKPKALKFDFFVKNAEGEDLLKGAYADAKRSSLRVKIQAGTAVKILVPQP